MIGYVAIPPSPLKSLADSCRAFFVSCITRKHLIRRI